jgi:hypothetical protein
MKIHSHRSWCAPIVLIGMAAVGTALAAEEASVPENISAIGASASSAQSHFNDLTEIIVEANEPRYVAPTFRDRIGRIWAPVYINGKGPFRLVLDTGANSSGIIEPIARALNVPVDASKRVRLKGATGSAEVPYININSLEVGELQLKNSRLPILPAVFGGADGILGSAEFQDKRIFIDFKNDVIKITRSHLEGPPLGYGRLPLKIGKHHLPTFDLLVGTIKTKAILDTGAQQSVGNLALRHALERRVRSEGPFDLIGVTLDVARVDAIPSPPIHLPGSTITGLRVTFGDMYIFEHWKLTNEPTMIIGMDVIGAFDQVIIDYRQRELYLRARSRDSKKRRE